MIVDPQIIALCEQVTAKRPRTVIDHIIKNGAVTTEELQALGYDHPPRAARDVRENGVPLETFRVKSDRTGRMIGAYRFADPSKIENGRIGGRAVFSKQFKDAMLARYGSRNTITRERLEGRYLQIDHRVPYEVAGDEAYDEGDLSAYMLLDASSQRAKSWSCENCRNVTEMLDEKVCGGCFWAFPESYSHIAMRQERRVDIVWSDDEIAVYDRLKAAADARGTTVAALMKELASKA